ncbi:MAG: DUF4178 domain-containing protein [Clostridium paraputrificum]
MNFDINSKIKIEGILYSVLGKISFINYADNYKWTEYKVICVNTKDINWLSVDETYDEYALYTQKNSSRGFSDDEILKKGYKEADYGIAEVTYVEGVADTQVGDKVSYREFEDITEEKIISIEDWDGDKEYSTGYYLDKDEITREYTTTYDGDGYTNGTDFSDKLRNNKSSIFLVGAVVFFILISLGGLFALMRGSDSKKILEYLKTSVNYEYSTSITSEVESDERADVYKTSFTVDSASKDIIDGIEGDVEDVQENTEDGTVAILTKDEYCLVYFSESNETLVQVSSRLYSYTSSNAPYRARHSSAAYYRRYYYSRGYNTDRTRYNKKTTSYENYDDGTINPNTNDKYKNYSESVRQSSTSSRPTSGGGTSSGK